MRRLSVKLAPLVTAAIVISCEDGPKQTYSPSPAGAGSQWNDGQTPAVVPDKNTQPFQVGSCTSQEELTGACAAYPQTGKTTLCSADLKRQRWAWMLSQPVQPPRFYAGIDMAKDDLWHGIKIDDAETTPIGSPSDWKSFNDPACKANAMAPGCQSGGLCQSVPVGYIGECPSGFGNCDQNYWGNNAEVIFTWNLATHKVDQMELQLGYLGGMEMDSKDKKHHYIVRPGDVFKKDGQPFLVDWNGNPRRQITELYNAAIATFGPAAGIAPIHAVGTCQVDADCSMTPATPFCISNECVPNCGSDGSCLVFSGGGQSIFGFRPLVIYVQGISGVPQPALSTPILFYNFFAKFEPYSNLPQQLKLDPEGPIAIGRPLGARDSSVMCEQKVGQKFGDAVKNCIQVHGTAGSPDMVDTVNLNKVLNGLNHDQEHWTVNAIGVNQNYTSEKVANNPDLVVLDEDTPQSGDFAQDFFFDLRARGHPRNDYNTYKAGKPIAPGTSFGASLDLRGTAMIHVEWARLMLADINRVMKNAGLIPKNQPPKRLGDPTCTGFDANGNPNFAPGCSGVEGLMIPTTGRGDFTKDASCASPTTCLDPGANWDTAGAFVFGSHLKPGDVIAGFCVDPGAYSDCFQAVAGGSASPFFTAHQWVLRRLGKGVAETLPNELKDRRYYYKFYAYAYVKYLKAYSDFQSMSIPDGQNMGGMVDTRDLWPCSTAVDPTCVNSGPGPTDVANQVIDFESLFFDNNNQGASNSFDKFEFIDRENVGKGQENTDAQKYNFIPWDFEYGCDLIGGNQRYDNYYRRMDREEIAMYASMLEDKTHTPGQENNVNITNLFGTVILPGIWPSYQCATGAAGDPATNGCGNPPPLDSTLMTACTATSATTCTGAAPCHGTCGAAGLCVQAQTFVNGIEQVCGTACDFTAHPATGCANLWQTCVASKLDGGATEACVDMRMDLNGHQSNARPELAYYPSAWSRSPFGIGHSPITIHAQDKHPNIGVAKITIPNFASGPYTPSPAVSTGTVCPSAWRLDNTGTFCNAPLDSGTGMHASSFTTLVPWLEVGPTVGFTFPIDGIHDQAVQSGQMDFTGVLETYLIDYIPWIDLHQPSCVTKDPAAMDACQKGYKCDPVSRACVSQDDTIQILAIESQDFLGEVFLCQDPKTGDILGVRQYDSAQRIVDWFANHPGGWDPVAQTVQPKAQDACSVILKYSPYNNYLDFITSKAYGVKVSINQGAGFGRVVDATLYDSSITQAQ